MTYEEIEAKRNELEERMSKEGYTDEIQKAWKALAYEELALRKESAIAYAESAEALIVVYSQYECGWAVESFINGGLDYEESLSVLGALRSFSEMAKKHSIGFVMIRPEYLDVESLEEMDREADKARDREEYEDACMASAYGETTLMERYNRKHGIEREYSPSNPWDAPGMKVSDFI